MSTQATLPPETPTEAKSGGGVVLQRLVRRQFGDCLLIHADWKDVLETLPTVAAVVTDPPYGIGKWSANSTGGYMTKDEADATSEWDEAPTREELLKLASLGVCVMWGGNYLDLPPCRTPLVWDKDQKGMHFAEVEIAWTNFVFGSARILACPIKKHETFGNKCHPTQKPIRVMSWSVQQTRVEMGQTVLDPYMGSGTTGIACIRTGHKFIGIEKDKRHFETACERIERELFRQVSTDKIAWEEYARNTFCAHAYFCPEPGKLRFLQYVTKESKPWWSARQNEGAILL